MKSVKVIINNETGLHARPASELVRFAKKFKSKISLLCDGRKANAISIISVLSLGAVKGKEIEIITEGEEEDLALGEMKSFIENLKG